MINLRIPFNLKHFLCRVIIAASLLLVVITSDFINKAAKWLGNDMIATYVTKIKILTTTYSPNQVTSDTIYFLTNYFSYSSLIFTMQTNLVT